MKIAMTTLLLLALTVMPAAAEDLVSNGNGSLSASGLSMFDVQPGARVAWMTLTREPVGNHYRLRIQRGVQTADGNGEVFITQDGADEARTLWLAAAVDGQQLVTLDAAAEGYDSSSEPVPSAAVIGATAITIESRQAEVIYVRRQVGAWFLSAMNGGLDDQDGAQDTVITIPLSSLQPFPGNPSAPTSVAHGDLVLVIDPYLNRTSMSRVSQ
jgi:hypothetical protein